MNSLLPFLAFAFVASATPGPNNIMVLAAAATHGPRAAIPLILGISAGFGVMVTLVGTGLAAPLAGHAGLHAALRWLGAAWLLLLAWQIARAEGHATDGRGKAPLGFWGAAAFQWINPKAWVLALATAATYTRPGEALTPQILTLAGLFVLICLLTLAVWALLGAWLAPWLAAPRRIRAFNIGMGVLLVLSVIPVLLD